VNQGLILGAVVGRLVVDLQEVLQVITSRGDEEYAYARTFEVQETIKVHLLGIRLLRWWGLLGLCPFRDKVCKNLGLDGLSWTKLKVELT
jgi:hypothetical protein